MGHIGDRPAQDRIAQIGVFVAHFGCAGKWHAGGEQPREICLRQWCLPVAPRIIGHKPGNMVQQIADRDARRIRRGIAPPAHFRNIFFRRVIQAEQALVAQRQDRQCGERLSHRCDAEQRVLGDRDARNQILHTHAAHIRQLAIDNDAIDHAGHVVFRHPFRENRVDLRLDAGDRCSCGFGLSARRRCDQHGDCDRRDHWSCAHDWPLFPELCPS